MRQVLYYNTNYVRECDSECLSLDAVSALDKKNTVEIPIEKNTSFQTFQLRTVSAIYVKQ